MKLLITAGPTQEPLDPVRYLSNRSSGKMGYAIALAAVAAGHTVVLVSGPTCLPQPHGLHFVPVRTAEQMYAAVAQHIGTCHAAIFCAAVADFRPKRLREQKIKKSEEMLLLELERTPDILGSARTKFGFHGLLVGFAAETDQVVAYAKAKLASKGCDLLLANDVSQPQSGFEVDVNQVRLLYADGREDPWPCMTKKEIGSRLVALLEGLHQAKTKQHRA